MPSPPAARRQFGPITLFIHMTGMSTWAGRRSRTPGAHVSLAVPIEMNMRHGTPPILKTLETGIQPSLSVDVECTLTADMFTQMRSTMTLPAHVHERPRAQRALRRRFPDQELLTTRDVLRFATRRR